MTHFDDKALSLTDCVSFEVVDRLALPTAFTFDRDFLDCGYRMVPPGHQLSEP
jgi:predicted nucleic acid-binding protein